MITSLDQLDLTKQYSYADYLAWQFEERVELIKGYIFPVAVPARRHQQISWNVFGMFWKRLKDASCKVYVAPFDVRLPRIPTPDNKKMMTVLQPDLCVICDLARLDDQGCGGALDLVVEILSQSNTEKEMKQKFDAYQDAGIQEYWLIQTEDRNVSQYVLNNEGIYTGLHLLTDEDELVSRVFPDLRIDLAGVFAD